MGHGDDLSSIDGWGRIDLDCMSIEYQIAMMVGLKKY